MRLQPNATIAGTSQTCSELFSEQSMTCTSLCMPLVPNGCDCFGGCALPASHGGFVYLGSADSSGNGTCSLAEVGDPSKCRPCTPVPSCMNDCGECELCLGKATLPSSCRQQTCDNGAAPCGLPGQDACAEGGWCVSGCCQATPQ